VVRGDGRFAATPALSKILLAFGTERESVFENVTVEEEEYCSICGNLIFGLSRKSGSGYCTSLHVARSDPTVSWTPRSRRPSFCFDTDLPSGVFFDLKRPASSLHSLSHRTYLSMNLL